MKVTYIEDEMQVRSKSTNLKMIYNHWSYDTVNDDEVARVLKPVLAMINAGAFNRNKHKVMLKIAESVCS